MYKREIKYLLPVELLPKVRDILTPYMRLDKFAGPKEDPDYTVRSIYFDTRKLKFYHEKNEGLQKRLKVRIRSYNTYTPKSIAFLELKRKEGAYIFIKSNSKIRIKFIMICFPLINYQNYRI